MGRGQVSPTRAHPGVSRRAILCKPATWRRQTLTWNQKLKLKGFKFAMFEGFLQDDIYFVKTSAASQLLGAVPNTQVGRDHFLLHESALGDALKFTSLGTAQALESHGTDNSRC